MFGIRLDAKTLFKLGIIGFFIWVGVIVSELIMGLVVGVIAPFMPTGAVAIVVGFVLWFVSLIVLAVIVLFILTKVK